MTPAQIAAVMPLAGARAMTYAEPLTAAMAQYGIDAPRRQAAFVAQIAHESGQLVYTRELASGDAYENRYDLGNTQPGDGPRFKGRGLIEITGRANYTTCGVALGLDLIANPELLEQPDAACRSAAWFWQVHGLSDMADADKFGSITHRINGGYNGIDERLAFWLAARREFGL